MLHIDPRIISERGKNQNKVQPIKRTNKTIESKNQREENRNNHLISKGKKQKEFQKMLQEKAKEANNQSTKKQQPNTISLEGRNYIAREPGEK